jgi:hypothetical protein
MRNITPAKLIELIVWDVLYATVKKNKIYPRSQRLKNHFFNTPSGA